MVYRGILLYYLYSGIDYNIYNIILSVDINIVSKTSQEKCNDHAYTALKSAEHYYILMEHLNGIVN